MKQKLIFLFSIFGIISLFIALISQMNKGGNINNNSNIIEEDLSSKKIEIVTSLYTTNILVKNLVTGIDNINITSLTNDSAGCAHDYQLTTDNMKSLAKADIFIMNGGGLEGYIEEIIKNYPEIYIINASNDIHMLDNINFHGEEDHEHLHENDDMEEEDHHEHNHGEFNPHIWLDPSLYIMQIENTRDRLIQYFSASSNANSIQVVIENNANRYIAEVNKVDEELRTLRTNNAKGIIIFHDSFAYIANRLNIPVLKMIELEQDTILSAGEIAEIIDIIHHEGVKILFSEEQFSENIPSKIAFETNSKVFIIDSAVSGDGSLDSYINAMRNNIRTIKEALEIQN